MYQIGDLIVYGNSGVCRVSAVGDGVPCAEAGRDYYTLDPLYGTETIYAPVDTKAYLRPVLTPAEADGLIQQIPTLSEEPVADKNQQLLTRYYQSSLQSHDCCDLLRLMKTIHTRTAAALRNGKRPGKLEEKYQKRVEELLYGEFAVVLGIARDDVPDYIRRALES